MAVRSYFLLITFFSFSILSAICFCTDLYAKDRKSVYSKITEKGYKVIKSHVTLDRHRWIQQIELIFYAKNQGIVVCSYMESKKCNTEDTEDKDFSLTNLEFSAQEFVEMGYDLDHIMIQNGSGTTHVLYFLSNNDEEFNFVVCGRDDCAGYK